ncbi:MAG: hypothetical protein PQJ58_14120 [Spirochaetales bacterium]|nr:hypothetical protein [Spirochaetales bacterium]
MNIKSAIKSAAVLFFLLLPVLSVFSQSSYLEEERILKGASFHENVEVRAAMADSINAPFYSLLTRQKEIHSQLLSPAAVEFELRKSEDSFYLIFKNELNYRYPVWGRGNYIIKRDLRSGEFKQIKIFLQNDELSYIRLFPLDENRSSLELTLYGVTLYSGIVLPVSLKELSVNSFARLMYLTKGTVRWDQIFSNASYPEWRSVDLLQQKIREQLPALHEFEDGAMDSEGHFVLIKDGSPAPKEGGVNCSGFAKWVADGMLLARGADTLLDLESLKTPTETESREKNPWSRARSDRDPYFGLDWSRNLASALRLSEPGASINSPLDMDVRTVPFFPYKEHVGYKLDQLKTLLYLQAVKSPGSIYFGAVNSLYGTDPALWQYYHIAVFFPWFDENGDFQLQVMETGSLSSLENLEARYPGTFIHLSRAGASDFISPGPENEDYNELPSPQESADSIQSAEEDVEFDDSVIGTFAR